jgi:hypothetical protein
MLYSNKKTTDIAISHVILEQFCMQLFSFMLALKHRQNLTVEQISTLVDRENNTTSCRLMGAGAEHHKAPPKIIIIQKKKKATTTGAGPQPYKAESNKRKQQAPNQRESTNRTNCTPKSPKHKLDPNKHNQQPTN